MLKEELVCKTCMILVRHFSNLIQHDGEGFHTRIFQHILHPEYSFVGAGKSKEVISGGKSYPEHVVPCAVLISEIKRLINSGNFEIEEIARLLQKHWKVAIITPEQARYIDHKLGYKSSMPEGWCFETGDTFARLNAANIELVQENQ